MSAAVSEPLLKVGEHDNLRAAGCAIVQRGDRLLQAGTQIAGANLHHAW